MEAGTLHPFLLLQVATLDGGWLSLHSQSHSVTSPLLLQVAAMDVESLPATSPEMAALLTEMGTAYDPDRLAQALQNRRAEVSARAIRVTATLGAFVARLAKVGGEVVCIFSLASVAMHGYCTAGQLRSARQPARVPVVLKASCEAGGGQPLASLVSVFPSGAATCQSNS